MKNSILFALSLLISLFSYADLNITTNTVWNTDLGVVDDIIIHNGASLTINCNLQMAGGMIRVKPGGRLIGQNGSIFGTPSSSSVYLADPAAKWTGIILELQNLSAAPNYYALQLKDFSIKDAAWGINSGYGSFFSSDENYKNVRISLDNVTFDENVHHFQLSNSYSGLGLGLYDHINDYFHHANIRIKNCKFQKAYSGWPVHIINAKRLTIMNCDFTDDGPLLNIAVHLRSILYANIISNSFNSLSTYHALAFHGDCWNGNITGNQFNLNPGYSRYGIDFGDFPPSIQFNFNVTNNAFYSDVYNDGAYGIIGKKDVGLFRSGQIKGNNFVRLKCGLELGGMNDDVLMEKNSFGDCSTGMRFHSDNPTVKIECNKFKNCINDIMILSGATLENQTNGYNPNNKFSIILPGAYNIVNNGPVSFDYQYNGFPPHISFGNLFYTTNTKSCEGGFHISESSLTNSTPIDQYPNPSNGIINYNFNELAIDRIVVSNIQGQVLEEIINPSTRGTINVQGRASGFLLIKYYRGEELIERKKLIVSK